MAAQKGPKKIPALGDQRKNEVRIYGENACLALFRARPDDIRKIYLVKELRQRFDEVLAYCAQKKVGFTFVSNEELGKISETLHHEGVCFVSKKTSFLDQATFTKEIEQKRGPLSVLLLERVENPHNFGAIIRTAAHFGTAGIIVTENSSVTLSGAVYRTAEGGIESITLGRLTNFEAFHEWSRSLHFTLYATSPRARAYLGSTVLAARSIFVMGSEGRGLSDTLMKKSDALLGIPGSGNVESLNVGVASGVLLWEYARQHRK